MASICHHGRPVGEPVLYQDAWWRPRLGLDPCTELAALMQRIRAWQPLAFGGGSDRLPTSTAFAHGFAGLVMLADWIGSDRRPSLFPFTEELGSDRLLFSRQRARRAIEHIGIDVEAARRYIASTNRSAFS